MKISNSIFDNLTKVRLGFVIVSFYLLLSCSLSEAKPPESDVSNSNENSQASINERNLVSGVVETSPETSNQNSTGLPQIADIVDKAKLGVATISTTSLVKGYFYNFEDQGNGSGFVVRPDGYIATNYHVVKGASEIKVYLPNGETYDAELIGRDTVTDLAML